MFDHFIIHIFSNLFNRKGIYKILICKKENKDPGKETFLG